MKKNLFLLVTGVIIFSAFIIPTEDYRDSYVGTYFCRSKCESLNSDYTELSYRNDTITVVITKNNTRDSVLNITIRGKVHELKLKNGVMASNLPSNQNRGRFFSTDSIFFSISPARIPNGCSYKGKKQ